MYNKVVHIICKFFSLNTVICKLIITYMDNIRPFDEIIFFEYSFWLDWYDLLCLCEQA